MSDFLNVRARTSHGVRLGSSGMRGSHWPRVVRPLMPSAPIMGGSLSGQNFTMASGKEHRSGLRAASRSGRIAYAIRPLSPSLLYLSNSLLQTPYEDGLRLLHAEAKTLELLCEIIPRPQGRFPGRPVCNVPAESHGSCLHGFRKITDIRRRLGAGHPTNWRHGRGCRCRRGHISCDSELRIPATFSRR